MSGALPLLRAASTRVMEALRGTPLLNRDALARIGRRLGLATAQIPTGIEGLVRLAKNNKFTTAWIAYELYGLSNPLVQDLRDADPEIDEMLRTVGFSADVVSESMSVQDISAFADELEMIGNAVAFAGSFERLMTLVHVMSFKPELFVLYRQVKSLSQAVR